MPYRNVDFSPRASAELALLADGVVDGTVGFDGALLAHQLLDDIDNDPGAAADGWVPIPNIVEGVLSETRVNRTMVLVAVWEPRPNGRAYIHALAWETRSSQKP